MEILNIRGTKYKVSVVTLDNIDMEKLLAGGKLDNRYLLAASVTHEDGTAVDWSTLPVGVAMKLLPLALKAAGFDNPSEGTAEGNA